MSLTKSDYAQLMRWLNEYDWVRVGPTDRRGLCRRQAGLRLGVGRPLEAK